MRVITLCGSTKFKKEFREVEAMLTLQGHIVISLGFFEKSDGIILTNEQEKMLRRCIIEKLTCLMKYM